MNDEKKIRRLLERIDALRAEVKSLLPTEDADANVPKVSPVAANKPISAPLQTHKPSVEVECEPTALELLVRRIADWLCVRGSFSPSGVNREFAVATRWLLRLGSVVLVGAMAYFLMLAVNRGWIGPVPRVYGILCGGAIGLAAGVLLMVKGRYAVLGEVFAALGLVAFYLALGLGHRFFVPPVIASSWTVFAGFVATTLTAGVIAVRFRSLASAALGLFGGFLALLITNMKWSTEWLEVYLLLLAVGACVVAYLRRWLLLGFAALTVAYVIGFATVGCYLSANSWTMGVGSAVLNCSFFAVVYALSLGLAFVSVRQKWYHTVVFTWLYAIFAAFAWIVSCFPSSPSGTFYGLYVGGAALLHAILALGCRRTNWTREKGGADILFLIFFFMSLFALFVLMDSIGQADYKLAACCTFAALLAEGRVRLREKILSVLSLVMTVFFVSAFLILFVITYRNIGQDGYFTRILARELNVWSVPILMLFQSGRLCGKGERFAVLKQPLAFFGGLFALMVISAESYWIGVDYLPSLKMGLMTIVWAVIASEIGRASCRERV